ncbi:MAG: phosphate acyltransferase PlsX [Pseudomonadota bacterium]
MRLSIDAMGGDRGPAVIVSACHQALTQHPSLHILLVGLIDQLSDLLSSWPADLRQRVELVGADSVIEMDDSPAVALRRKKTSSMRVALEQVANGNADACISSGNTGALMALSRIVLKMLPGIDRPAIMAEIPARDGRTFMLDVGANSECTVDQLYQFAVMGSVVAANLLEKQSPTIGLLNIGSEAGKGNEVVRDTAERLADSHLNFAGFVEGDTLFDPAVDVVVTDGFTGNVALKTMEGTANLVRHRMRESFLQSWLSKLQALLARPVLNDVGKRLDPRKFNGASLVGLGGIVVKSHGGSDEVAFGHAIETTIMELAENVPEAVRRGLKSEAA